MELDTPDWHFFMADAHHFQFRSRLGNNLQIRRHAVAPDEQRVIPGRRKRTGHAGKERIACMIDGGSFAMHEAGGPDDFAAENMPHTLVAETNPQRRDGRAEGPDNVVGQAGFPRRTGPRRDENPVRFQLANLVERNFVIPENPLRHAEFPEVLDEVVSKTIVVIDDQQHTGGQSKRIGDGKQAERHW